MMYAILGVITTATIINLGLLFLIYYYVNRNWEWLIDLKNKLNQLEDWILIIRNRR